MKTLASHTRGGGRVSRSIKRNRVRVGTKCTFRSAPKKEEVMKMTIRYVWAACLLAGSALTVSAGLIPEDKQLDPAWVESLTERGHALDRGLRLAR